MHIDSRYLMHIDCLNIVIQLVPQGTNKSFLKNYRSIPGRPYLFLAFFSKMSFVIL